jgi:hypothetical protein
MWLKPKQPTWKWEAVATGPSYCRKAGMTGQELEGSEHVAQAKATHPEAWEQKKVLSNASTGMLNGDGRIPQFLVTADSGVIPLWLRNDGGVEETTMLT